MIERDDTHTPAVDYAERRRLRAAERASSYRHRVPRIVLAALVVALLGVAAFEVASTYGRIHPGVSVSGIDVGRMTPGEAASLLQTQLPRKAEKPVVVVHEDEEWQVTAEMIGLRFDYTALAQDAMRIGREGGVFVALSDRVDAWVGGMDMPATASADEQKMVAVLDKVRKGTDIAPVDATVKFTKTTPKVVESKPGVELRAGTLQAAILASMLQEERTITAPVATAAVAVTDAEAARAAAVAKTMVSEPVKVTFESKSWSFDSADIAKWIEFRRSDETDTPEPAAVSNRNDVKLIPVVSPKKAGKSVIPAVGAKLGRKAKDARFKTAAGQVTIVPSEDGIGPDMDALAESLTQTLPDASASRSVELKTARTEPDITTADAEKMGIRKRLGRFTTTYAANNESRVNNIHLLGDSLDGTLVAPGKTFSFNGSIGQRTAEKGYQEANAIVNGKLVPQLGGGICQVGTTIFNAVFESGLPVVQRRNHSFYISHYPKGRDATVSWGGPDFKFKNDTDNWVLVSVAYTSSSITVALYGTDPGYEVESETSDWRNIRKFKVEEIKDKTLAKGVRVVEDAGVDGKSITVKRIVSKDGKVIRTDSFVSVYKPKTEVVRVGTKKIETEKTDKTESPDPDAEES